MNSGSIHLEQKPRTVRMMKIVDTEVPSAPLSFELQAPATGAGGHALTFQGIAASPETPILAVHWDFGDGSSGEGAEINHTYTHSAGTISLTSTGLNSAAAKKMKKVTISGEFPILLDSSQMKRADERQ